MDFDFSKSLEELENNSWGDLQQTDATDMMRRCYELRRKAIQDLNAEDCRLLLGQNIGARFIVPRAVEILTDEPLAGGDMLPGALLRYVLELESAFWTQNPDLWWDIQPVIHEVKTCLEQIQRILPLARRFELLQPS